MIEPYPEWKTNFDKEMEEAEKERIARKMTMLEEAK